MDKLITIIGSGNMARAIGRRSKAAGYTVKLHVRNEGKAMELAEELQLDPLSTVSSVGSEFQSDLVVIAAPYSSYRDIATAYGAKFEGKIAIDIANPVEASTFSLITPNEGSAAEALQALLPQSHVIKAFNTVFASVLFQGSIADKPLDVFVAGTDQPSRTRILSLVTDMKLHGIDAGELQNARYLEGFQFIHIKAQQQLQTNYGSAIQIITP